MFSFSPFSFFPVQCPPVQKRTCPFATQMPYIFATQGKNSIKSKLVYCDSRCWPSCPKCFHMLLALSLHTHSIGFFQTPVRKRTSCRRKMLYAQEKVIKSSAYRRS